MAFLILPENSVFNKISTLLQKSFEDVIFILVIGEVKDDQQEDDESGKRHPYGKYIIIHAKCTYPFEVHGYLRLTGIVVIKLFIVPRLPLSDCF